MRTAPPCHTHRTQTALSWLRATRIVLGELPPKLDEAEREHMIDATAAAHRRRFPHSEQAHGPQHADRAINFASARRLRRANTVRHPTGSPPSQDAYRVRASVDTLLRVIADFEPFGGTTQKLTAWELGVELRDIAPEWDALEQTGLITGPDSAGLYRLSTRARRLTNATPTRP